jgi:hypothetical protein
VFEGDFPARGVGKEYQRESMQTEAAASLSTGLRMEALKAQRRGCEEGERRVEGGRQGRGGRARGA